MTLTKEVTRNLLSPSERTVNYVEIDAGEFRYVLDADGSLSIYQQDDNGNRFGAVHALDAKALQEILIKLQVEQAVSA